MRSFLSLLLSFALVSLGDILNMSIANSISLAAIGVMGAYYTINWIAKELTNFGIYTYRVERRDEWQYLQIAFLSGLAGGIAISAFSGHIPLAFGIDEAQKASLAAILSVYFLALPLKSTSIASLEIIRLRSMLREYRHMVVGFYAMAIPVNFAMFFLFHNVIYIIVADMAGNLFCVLYCIFHLRKTVRFGWLSKEQLVCAARFGSPLVGERLVYRIGLAVYGVCASYLPTELYAIHTVCFNAAGIGEIGDQAYSAALLVLVPDKNKRESSRERYLSERARTVKYKKSTAWVVVAFSVAISYVAAIASHGSTDLPTVLWFMAFYCTAFIPMCISTPGKDFLTIQKHPAAVMAGTLCGVPFYVIIPLVSIFLAAPSNSMAALCFFGLTGAAQIGVRALLYTVFIKKMDRQLSVTAREIRSSIRDVAF